MHPYRVSLSASNSKSEGLCETMQDGEEKLTTKVRVVPLSCLFFRSSYEEKPSCEDKDHFRPAFSIV